MNISPRQLVAAVLLIPSVIAVAEVDFEIDQKQSQVDQSLNLEVPFAGVWIGDYDAKSNPDGTQTRPGLFGGSGNNPINYSAAFSIDGGGLSQPSGSFSVALDEEGLSGVLDALVVDLLSGQSSEVGLTIDLAYSSFNTINPFSIYPGGIPISLPLGNAQVISASLESTGPAPIVLVPDGEGYFFTGLMNGVNRSEVELGTGVQEFEVPVIIPLAGTLAEVGNEWVMTVTFSQAVSDEQPVEDAPPFENIPVPLPTLPPSDNTANLLMSGAITSYTVDSLLDVQLIARGSASGIFGDLNGDGIVDGGDRGLLIIDGGVNPGSPADLNGDGLVDGGDLGLMVLAWTPM